MHIEKEDIMKNKIIFVSSSGGHFEQLMMLGSLIEKNDSMIITEKTSFSNKEKNIRKFIAVNRKEKLFLLKMLINSLISLNYLIKFRPELIISTGTLCTIPICILAKLFKVKTIYIESYAKVKTPTKTGEFLYGKVDLFIVQWEEMLAVYPDAIYIGGIY